MSNLRLRQPLEPGCNSLYQAESGPVSLLSFSLLNLERDQEYILNTGGEEYALVFLTGLCDLEVAGESHAGLGGRTSVFEGKGTAAYLPPGLDARLTASSAAVVALCSAPSQSTGSVQIVRPDQVQVNHVGNWNWRRQVHNLIGANVPQAQRLVVGESFNPPGNWSSYPPHRHEVDDYPFEVHMEEIYYFRVNPPQGFGMQRVYTDDRSLDEGVVVEDGDTVLLPRGYHPVVAAPGYQLYYLWMLAAGSDRRMKPRDDPAHTWVKAAGDMARDMGF